MQSYKGYLGYTSCQLAHFDFGFRIHQSSMQFEFVLIPCLLVKGAYISHHMKLVDAAGANRGGRGRVWQCKLCRVEGSEANVALHIHEAHT
jgi:hypothetical protein